MDVTQTLPAPSLTLTMGYSVCTSLTRAGGIVNKLASCVRTMVDSYRINILIIKEAPTVATFGTGCIMVRMNRGSVGLRDLAGLEKV